MPPVTASAPPAPRSRRRDPVHVVRVLGGRATWAELSRHSTQHAVRGALARRTLVRSRRGLYVLADLPPPHQAAAGVGGVLSHASAAQEHGLGLLMPPDAIHVTVPRGTSSRRRSGVVLHSVDVPAQDRTRTATTVLRTVLDCATTLPFAEALAVADSALREGLLGKDDLIAAAEGTVNTGRGRRLRVARAADGDAANPFESALRAVVLEAGIAGFVPQWPVPLPRRTAVVDLGDPVRRIVLEADSFAHHGSRFALSSDCRRYDELVRCGWLVLRFAWEHVMFDRSWVAGVLRDTCALRPRRRTSDRGPS